MVKAGDVYAVAGDRFSVVTVADGFAYGRFHGADQEADAGCSVAYAVELVARSVADRSWQPLVAWPEVAR
jgi:uncharacterized membrane protein